MSDREWIAKPLAQNLLQPDSDKIKRILGHKAPLIPPVAQVVVEHFTDRSFFLGVPATRPQNDYLPHLFKEGFTELMACQDKWENSWIFGTSNAHNA